jgi:hypothetical protein
MRVGGTGVRLQPDHHVPSVARYRNHGTNI